MISEFVKLYFEEGSIDKALVKYQQIVSVSEFVVFIRGLEKLRN